MAEYIKREKAWRKVNRAKNIEEALNLIDSLPAADVVPVVRCKDCVARGQATLEPFVCSRNKILVYNNCYCSYGERRCSDEQTEGNPH